MNTQIKYRTFDELMDEVRLDFFTYEMEGMIEPSQLIKVAQKVNYDLGLRIYTEKQKVLEIVITSKEVNISNLTAGVYIIKIKEGEATATRKLIIN